MCFGGSASLPQVNPDMTAYKEQEAEYQAKQLARQKMSLKTGIRSTINDSTGFGGVDSSFGTNNDQPLSPGGGS